MAKAKSRTDRTRVRTEVSQVQLKEFFKLFAPTYVLGTTYTVSLAFFEALVYPEIKRSNLRGCLILCDKIGFQRATVEASALRSVGREYMAICAPARHAFHPKVWIMIGEGKAALLVGSGNLTQSGFMENAELFDVVQLVAGGPNRIIADDIARFVFGLRSLWSRPEARQLMAITTLDEVHRELTELALKMPDDPDPGIRFLSNFGRPLVEQFGEVFLGGTLQVAAPYFGGSTRGVRLLQNQLAPTEVRVFPALHNGTELDVNLAELRSLPGVSVRSLKMGHNDGFSHLKLYGFDSDGGQWLFTTSANCTEAALGGDNVEAGLLRRVDRRTLDDYFADEPRGTLPDTQRVDKCMAGDGWLPFWASDRGDAIELLVGESDHLPLTNVTISVKLGGNADTRSIPKLFGDGVMDRVEWSMFRQLTDRASHPALVSLDALNSSGKQVRGDALVDNPLLLGSDPTHRSAWRAALSLLGSEGLPESADLASIFHLVQTVFDADDDKTDTDGSATRISKSSLRSNIPDKIPIWPPLAHQEWMGAFTSNGHLHDLQWFQKILSEFLNPKHEKAEAATPVTTADSMDDEATAQAKQSEVSESLVRSLWKQATSSNEQLRKRLLQLIITENSARKIWPVATAIFLVTLVTRRKICERSNHAEEIQSVADLVRGFLQMLFADRSQSADYHAPASCRYQHTTFPSIADDLSDTFNQRPSNDISGIICLMFAYWHASNKRQIHRNLAFAWLQFREVAPGIATGTELDKEAIRTAFDKFVLDESAGIGWSDIELAIGDLTRIDWSCHEGYQELTAIIGRAECPSTADNFPPHLEERWPQTLRRIQTGQPWRFAVGPFSDSCEAEGCISQFVFDPNKRKDFRRCAPTICNSCGVVLIPERLWRAYEEAHERNS